MIRSTRESCFLNSAAVIKEGFSSADFRQLAFSLYIIFRTGQFVRLAPNHVSINNPDAIQVVYAHGNGSLKSNFYDAFVSLAPGIFNTRSRSAHARKRKMVAHIFSQKSVLDFEPHVHQHVSQLLDQWDRLCELAKLKSFGMEVGGWRIDTTGRIWFDCLPWYNYLALDIICKRRVALL